MFVLGWDQALGNAVTSQTTARAGCTRQALRPNLLTPPPPSLTPPSALRIVPPVAPSAQYAYGPNRLRLPLLFTLFQNTQVLPHWVENTDNVRVKRPEW